MARFINDSSKNEKEIFSQKDVNYSLGPWNIDQVWLDASFRKCEEKWVERVCGIRVLLLTIEKKKKKKVKWTTFQSTDQNDKTEQYFTDGESNFKGWKKRKLSLFVWDGVGINFILIFYKVISLVLLQKEDNFLYFLFN